MKYLGCPLFKNINESEIKEMLTCFKAKELKFSQGEEICSYNNKKGLLGIVLQGKAYVKKLDFNGNYFILENLTHFDIFSDQISYVATDVNYISVYAVTDVTVLLFDFTEVFKRCAKACKYHSTLVENLMQIVIEKTKTLSQRIELLSNKTIKDKFLGYCNLMLKNAKHKKDENSFTLPMSYTSLAEYLCVDRSALMREIKKLNEQKIIFTDKKTIKVLKTEYI
ncbi:MAG: Crp/Fnr family transcriptional regulator [Clostridia bacterium]|nr:Crp/Fnr family transcriptional regulator [Clostridia bacterium]